MPPSLVLVEGLTELRYFEAFFVAALGDVPRIAAVGEADPRVAVQRLRRDPETPPEAAWLIWDVDPQAGQVRARQLRQAVRTAETLGARVGLCNPCFEFWLWLHVAKLPDGTPPLPAETWLRRCANALPGYRKAAPFTPAWVRDHVGHALSQSTAQAPSADALYGRAATSLPELLEPLFPAKR
ncbi:MAG: RloB family protein [Opitutales bacterium]